MGPAFVGQSQLPHAFCVGSDDWKLVMGRSSWELVDVEPGRGLETDCWWGGVMDEWWKAEEKLVSGKFDEELRLVLELATTEELFELENILYGPRTFEGLGGNGGFNRESGGGFVGNEWDGFGNNPFMVPHGLGCPSGDDEFQLVLNRGNNPMLEEFANDEQADARSTLRGLRPSYRNVLLGVRRKLKVPCSSELSTEDLEVEIFLHLLQEYSSQESDPLTVLWDDTKISNNRGSLGVGLSQWKVQVLAALRTGAKELQETFVKGGGILTMSKILQLLRRRFSGKMIMEAANCQMKHEIMKRGGQSAAINLQSRAALFAARKGLAGAASRYLGLRSLMSLLGPLLWGTFLAEVVIQSLGTDYARILRAIYAFAQIRLTRTYTKHPLRRDVP
ncbi:hypothetical protein HPP92_015554 [Vanilla planifolia]|uniref:Uncharacterized protein n=1 Tax=Vanilla planifolia TaxID=51239 RepID=A0A835UR99_VANPL|nr:hypothetical protein HPP92_015554 [Vanilla planifolia]